MIPGQTVKVIDKKSVFFLSEGTVIDVSPTVVVVCFKNDLETDTALFWQHQIEVCSENSSKVM